MPLPLPVQRIYGAPFPSVRTKAVQDFRRMFALEWDAVAFGHGWPLPRNAKAVCAEGCRSLFGCDLRES